MADQPEQPEQPPERITKRFLRQEMEGYRRVAFPARKITTRDQQNHALVARGSYFAIQRLLEKLNGGQEQGVDIKALSKICP